MYAVYNSPICLDHILHVCKMLTLNIRGHFFNASYIDLDSKLHTDIFLIHETFDGQEKINVIVVKFN